MTNTLPFLPIELQNIIFSYTRPVYPYMRYLKNIIKIFELKNENYKLKYEEESGLTFNNHYFCRFSREDFNIYKDYVMDEIEDMGINYMDTEYYESLEEKGIVDDEINNETNFLNFYFNMFSDNRREYIDFREFINDFENRDSDSDSDSDSDNEIYIYSDTG